MKNMNFLDKWKKNQEEPSTYKARKSHIPFRLNFLFFIIFGLFVSLIVRLGYLQIVEGADYEERISQISNLEVESASPRGEIYDVNGTALVSNKSNLAITYTRGKNVQAEDILEIANRVNELINVPAEELTERDKKDYWLANSENLKAAQDRLTDKDKTDEKGNTITNESTLYSLTVDKVTEEEINFDEYTLQAATIFKKMNSVLELNTTFIKNDGVTEDEIAVIGEHVAQIPGVSTGMDWTREYPQGDLLRTILGTVSTEKSGLPAEEVEEYLAKGYARNDRVGTSYLEKQYESVLQGTKSKSQLVVDNNGKVTSQTLVSEGEKGQNLKLTIDSKFQTKVEEVVKAQYEQLLQTGKAPYSDGVYVAVTNPKTGAVLAMVGYNRDLITNALTPDPLSIINKAFEPGSVVKGATISAGYEAGIINGNESFIDEPFQIGGSNLKSSNFNPVLGNRIEVTAEQALEYSSNVYMMQLVLRMLGTEYSYNMTVPYTEGDSRVFDILRTTYAEYGMGVSTGIDLPGESTGLVPSNFDDPDYAPSAGNLLDLSFGQYDNYTALQLAQYVGTIANDGKRMKAHIVDGIYDNNSDGTIGELVEKIEPEVLNEVNISAEQMDLIQRGFHQVVYGTSGFTTGRYMAEAALEMGAKTGTAEAFYRDEDGTVHSDLINSNVVAYAPYDDPEIAISVILPRLNNDTENYKANQYVVNAIVNAYAEMYKQ
ncbi:penicillin-binding protein 2 [Enterococcus sp. BWB1-3]|uniref:penicillin-binding transpeptidase domain-containing protein n=1 Tax=unclassified Enterococcus TaxID=2608891 RepID=UPI001920E58E|nr:MULTISPECIES: penicillin-binding transpeptidase domain-containing protein [unclassified Enterococcus]MBL1230665.1 penicillin-binding protein 2 [Enterococcus sp. BWB1-3]MCB5952193.1 penicillin-binding protein 2 [Enterococcus sp. BWT-B8]MCB5956032.1 penicillin-binding protein 2 [Enterococcus sp. CWB-B31]